MKNNYTQQEKDNANSQNIIDYLHHIHHPIIKEGSKYWRSKEYRSLIIRESDGYFNWNSRGISGFKPVELAKQLLMQQGYPEKTALVMAIHNLNSMWGVSISDSPLLKNPFIEKDTVKEALVIPAADKNNIHVIKYLHHERGIDKDIINKCIKQGKVYQTKQYSNVAFVSKNKKGEIKHIFIKGTSTLKPFRMDSKGSDKSCPFILEGTPTAKYVYVFESSIDALSHATLCKINNKIHTLSSAHRLSLHGTSFGALKTFLADNPSVTTIIPCLDADEAGQRRSEKMQVEFIDQGYVVKEHRLPTVGKDYNEMLLTCKKYGLKRKFPV